MRGVIIGFTSLMALAACQPEAKPA